MVVNGFEFTSRLAGTSACYHIAKRGEQVFTSKSMTYLIRKCEEQSPPNAAKAYTPNPFAHLVGR
jgi:hypothetical protein